MYIKIKIYYLQLKNYFGHQLLLVPKDLHLQFTIYKLQITNYFGLQLLLSIYKSIIKINV